MHHHSPKISEQLGEVRQVKINKQTSSLAPLLSTPSLNAILQSTVQSLHVKNKMISHPYGAAINIIDMISVSNLKKDVSSLLNYIHTHCMFVFKIILLNLHTLKSKS
jgi:hypothetical protein